MVSFGKKGFKYFIGYKNSKLDLYVYFFQQGLVEEALMKLNLFFFIKDDELLEKYNETWEKVKNSIRKEFDIKPVYNEKHLKGKIESYNGKINTNFFNNKNTKRRFTFNLFISNFDQFCF